MPKNSIHGKTGKVINGRRRYGNIIADHYDGIKRKEERAKNPLQRVKGIRAIVIEAYQKGGKKAAYKAIEMANERLGLQAYSDENVDNWIDDYEQTR